jgi:hypothetical protein
VRDSGGVVGALVIGAAVATAMLVAASARLPGLVATLLVAYLALLTNVGLVTWALSPLRVVTRAGLAAAEAVFLAGALVLWWRRGRPALLLLTGARTALREIVVDPPTALFLAVIVALLGYELVVALTAPANNWDSLTYHLARTAAWVDHGGIYWIQNAPSVRLNQFPPFAEQENLFLFAATGSGALFALPQYLAELAILLAVYGAARRLGHGVRAAACSSFLLATFSFVALQATTAQNDLVAASFPIVAACLILGGSRLELALAGVTVGIGLGAKPDTALVLPVLVVLLLVRGRRAVALATAGGIAGFVAIGMWVYVLNLAHTGHLSGYGGYTHFTAPGQESLRPGHLATAVDVVYETLDLSLLSDRQIHLLELIGGVAAGLIALYGLRRRRLRWAIVAAIGVAVPFFSPLLVTKAGDVVAFFARDWGFPVRGPGGNVGGLNRSIDGSAFGPVGAVVLIGVPLVTMVAYVSRRVDVRHLALAFAFPLFLVGLSESQFNFYLPRFLLVPAALSAPLFARLFGNRASTAAYLVVASLVVGLVVTRDVLRPLNSVYGHPWQLTQVQAVDLTQVPEAGPALAAYDRLVPRHACVGAVLGGDEPSYLLSGPGLEHKVVYLPVSTALDQAYKHLLFYVVVSTGDNRWAAGQFEADGWRIRPLGSYWLLAVAPHAGDGECGSPPAVNAAATARR